MKQLNIQSPQNTKLTGKVWLAGFMKRHQKLNLLQPELMSLAKVSGLIEVVVHTVFDVLENTVDENKITDLRIFSIHETSHRVLKRPEKIIAQKDKHQIGAISSRERRQNVTDVYAVSVGGFCVPSVLIYPRKRMMESLSYRATPGNVFRCQDKSWMDSEVFCEWKRHFIAFMKPTPQEKVLPISDRHSSHNLSLAVRS
jgi:hypothetical protein